MVSTGDPILRAHRRAAAHRRRARGLSGLLGRALLLLLGVAALTAIFRPAFLSFLDTGTSLAAGTGGAVLRVSVVLVGLAGIDVYEAVIRGRDREVLALLPVDPASAVRAQLLRLVGQRIWILPSLAALLLPIGLEASWLAWAAAVAATVGVQVFAWPAAAVVHLLAVGVADDPRWAPLLDLARGANPRGQAAFVYAPGLLLVGGSALVYGASSGAAWAIAGDGWGWAAIALGPMLAVGLAAVIPGLARRAWFRASAVLSEIDAAYAGLVDTEAEQRHVYLDWALRFLPASLRRDALKDLRHGWRGRRLWLSGAWALGIAGGLAAWTVDPSGPSRGLAVAALGAALVASVGLVLALDEPPFLRWWLPRDPLTATSARFVVIWAWAQPAVLPAAAMATFMSGWGAGGLVLGLGEGALVVVTALALGCSRLGRTGPWVYAPTATLLVAGLIAGLTLTG